jgi:hypothetical protein
LYVHLTPAQCSNFSEPHAFLIGEFEEGAVDPQWSVVGRVEGRAWRARPVHVVCWPCVSWLAFQLLLEANADPTDDVDGLAVADSLIARPIRAFLGRLAAPGNQRVVIIETL